MPDWLLEAPRGGATFLDSAEADPASSLGPNGETSENPFSDGYSLNDFLSDALAFGVMPEALPETEWERHAAAPEAEVPLDLGEPLPEDQDAAESTHPSRNGRQRRPTRPFGVARS